MPRNLSVTTESWPIAGGFTISRGTKTEVNVVLAEIRQGEARGRGECVPYARYGETVGGVLSAIEAQTAAIAGGIDRDALRNAMPAGAARNALDCALIDLEAKLSGRSAAAVLGLAEPEPFITAYTLSLGTADAMADAARAARDRPLIKVKLGGAGDADRIRAVRANAPEARLIVDANEAWTDALFDENMTACVAAGVELVEQPLPADADGALATLERPVPVCADESVHTAKDLAALADRYDAVNIKLDKSGGLTEALSMVDIARKSGMTIMIGSMLATSLAVAPACLIAEHAAFVDIDGPLLLAKDRKPGLVIDGSWVTPPSPRLWG